MRKLILQVQMSVDGFIAGPNGEQDWMTWTWDRPLENFVNKITDSIDTILLGRKMSVDFLAYWENVVNNQPGSIEFEFAKKMVNTSKIIFSKTINTTNGKNTVVNNGDLAEEVNKLKSQSGKDIIAYGGATFDASLINAGLVDDFYLFVNPVAIGKGMGIFNTLPHKLDFKLVNATGYECGITVLHYRKK